MQCGLSCQDTTGFPLSLTNYVTKTPSSVQYASQMQEMPLFLFHRKTVLTGAANSGVSIDVL